MGQNDSSGAPGEFDHVKWLVYMNHQASSGYPGFDALYDRELTCDAWLSGRTYGTERHPFTNTGISSNDIRLASFAQNTLDFETGMVFDFFFTNTTVYALYERFYFRPGSGGFIANSFWDEASQRRNRLFGQGAEIRVQSYRVSGTRLSCGSDDDSRCDSDDDHEDD